jgi:F-type H+-transporting ATPase subunit epsilon
MPQAPTIQVEIVSAEGEMFSGPALAVFVPGSQGELGIYPRHTALLSLLKIGEARVQTPDGQEHFFFIGGGAVEVQPYKVTILADTAMRAKDIDEAAALAARQRAQEALDERGGRITVAEAQAELVNAIVQLRVLSRLREHKG